LPNKKIIEKKLVIFVCLKEENRTKKLTFCDIPWFIFWEFGFNKTSIS